MTVRVAMRQWAWRRLIVIASLFAVAALASLLDWHTHPPVPRAGGVSINMRNADGDLTAVLWLYLVEFVLAAAAFQPWRPRPRRTFLGLTGLLFGVWGALRWLFGLHSPPVMFPHDLLMLGTALVLCGATLVFDPDEPPRNTNAQVT